MSEIEVDENVVLRIEDKPEHHIEPHILGNSMEVEDLAENVVSLGSVPTKSGLLFIEDVPEYHKQPHILRGYRPETHSRWDMFRSIFAIHNETGNIWTHLVPAGYFLVVAAQFGLEMAGHPEWPHWYECTLLIGLIGATDYMLFASVAYHACKSGDEQTCTCMLARDQGGIVILVASSYFTGIALGFRCLPTLRIVYLLFTGAVVLLLSTPLLRPNLISRKLVKPLLIFCISIGLVPAIHLVCEARGAEVFLVVPYLLSMFGCYATGAMFLLSHWPEKSYPGQFDFVGSSHQLWHVFVVLAAYSWVRGMFGVLEKISRGACPGEGGAFS